MSAKEIIMDFLNFFFLIFLIIFCIAYFIAGDHFFAFTLFLKSMVPLAFFGIIFLIRLKITRLELRARKKHADTILALHLTIIHKLVSDLIVFGTPILLGLLIYKARGIIDSVDIMTLIMLLLIMFFWQKYIFDKEG